VNVAFVDPEITKSLTQQFWKDLERCEVWMISSQF